MWSKDFALLIQGQAVSCFGNTLYSVVVSLWVYEMTGSTVIMSIVYSATNLARLLTFPFAGVIADSFSRRNLIVCCDVVCGLSMLAVAAVSAKAGRSAVWALVGYSVVSSACYGVFNVSMSTLMLLLVKKKHFVQANSVYNAVEYGIDMIGQGIAGTFYLLLGAPVLFFINGLTFLFSAATELFIRKDPKPKRLEQKPFRKDAMEGVRYILYSPGVRMALLIAFLINFSFGILRVALVPWVMEFGESSYGLLGSFQSAGVILGTVLLAIKSISPKKQYSVYYWSQIAFVSCIALSALMPRFIPIAVLFCIAYVSQYTFNTLQRSVVILAVPDAVRGKVICAIQALAMGFSAVGNLSGGVLCEVFYPQTLVFVQMLLLLAGVILMSGRQSVKDLFAIIET